MSQAQYLDGYDDGFAVGVRLAKSKGWGGQASVSITDPALKYGYWYWRKHVKGDNVNKDTMSYSMSPDRFMEFMTWYLGISGGASSVVEEQMDNFAVWYRHYAGGEDASMGDLFQEYVDWLRANGLVKGEGDSSGGGELHPVDITLPGGTNFWIYDEDKDVFAHWYNSETHVMRIPLTRMAEFTAWYNANYENDEYSDPAGYTALAAGVNAMSDNAVYGGTYTDGRYVVYDDETAADMHITVRNLDISGGSTSLILSKPSDETAYPDNKFALTVEGDNTLSTTGRALSISTEAYGAIRGNYDAINNFETPTLTLIGGTTKNQTLKGNYYISDVVLSVTTTTMTEGDVEHIIADGPATVVFNGGSVTVYQGAGGHAYVDMGNCFNGVALITTRSEPDDGYVLSGYMVNDVFYPGEISQGMNIRFPAPGAALSVEPVFALSDQAKKTSFAVLADIHLRADNWRGNVDDFDRAVQMIKNNGVKDCYISGDLGYEHLNEERELFKQHTSGTGMNFYICTGNHDSNTDDAEWTSDTGHPKNCFFIKDGIVFVFMSLNQSTSTHNTASPYPEEVLTWFEGILDDNPDKLVVVFTHFPLTNASSSAGSKFAGMGSYTTYGFSNVEPQNNRILADIKEHGHVIYVTGHTHFLFEAESVYPNNNVSGFDDYPFVKMVHVPSLGYPRDSTGAVPSPDTPNGQRGQGYIVDVYDGALVFKGYDFSFRSPYQLKGTLLPDYVYEIPTGLEPGVLLSDPFHGTAYAGNEYTVYVTLAGGVQSATLTTTGGITLSKYSVSASEGLRIPITVTIDEEAEGSCSITASSAGVPDKTVVFTAGPYVVGTIDLATITATSGAPTDGAIYYGSGTTRFTEGSSGDTTTGTKTFGFLDATLRASGPMIYLPRAKWNYTMDFYGTTTLTCTTDARVLSCYAATEALFVGHGGASLIGSNTGTTVIPLKGNLTFRNLKLHITTPHDSLHEAMGQPTDENIVLEGNSSIVATSATVSNMKVELISECSTGYVRLKCGSLAGTPLEIDLSKVESYSSVQYYINGSETPVTTFPSDLVPTSGSTVSIRAVVTSAPAN